MNFEQELKELLNRYSIENESDTPDFLLAEYLLRCLTTWNFATKARDKWYGYYKKPSRPIEPNDPRA